MFKLDAELAKLPPALRDQCNTLFKDLFNESVRSKQVLVYLLVARIGGRSLEYSDIARDIYEYTNPSKVGMAAARKIVSHLRHKLREYNGRSDPAHLAKNPFVITIEGAGATYVSRETGRPNRRDALIGRWHGDGEDTWVEKDNTQLLKFEVDAEFCVDGSGSEVSGHFTIKVPNYPEFAVLNLRGTFYNDFIIQTLYTSSDKGSIQAGVALLKLAALGGTSIHVRYSAFSPSRECLTTGKIDLKKGQ